jgi:leukotriene-A4 hydrolase
MTPRMTGFSTLNQTYNSTHTNYSFEMNITIPSYLLAFAIGNLVERSVGPRTFVITEPTMMDKCANEMKNLSLFLDTAEAYMTPYIWTTYALLVLPPSFPLGGMENPLLTFASPTIIVGDGSQVYVATHEICHSWTGNDVTCENWSNMWLNEGFTTFEERVVSGQIYGENFAKTEAILGNASLWTDISNYGTNSSYSALYPIIDEQNPDDSYSNVVYEKGYQFLVFLESLVTPTMFQSFL